MVVLVPTRELAIQVAGEIQKLKHDSSDFRVQTVYGGEFIFPQIDALRAGVEIVVATPGRILDMKERNAISYEKVEAVVLDETD
jgi:ATP-dependent RNA helicase DeaD